MVITRAFGTFRTASGIVLWWFSTALDQAAQTFNLPLLLKQKDKPSANNAIWFWCHLKHNSRTQACQTKFSWGLWTQFVRHLTPITLLHEMILSHICWLYRNKHVQTSCWYLPSAWNIFTFTDSVPINYCITPGSRAYVALSCNNHIPGLIAFAIGLVPSKRPWYVICKDRSTCPGMLYCLIKNNSLFAVLILLSLMFASLSLYWLQS